MERTCGEPGSSSPKLPEVAGGASNTRLRACGTSPPWTGTEMEVHEHSSSRSVSLQVGVPGTSCLPALPLISP